LSAVVAPALRDERRRRLPEVQGRVGPRPVVLWEDEGDWGSAAVFDEVRGVSSVY